jgi:hypothetical protein
LPQRSNQLGNGKGQRAWPGCFGHVGQGYLPLSHTRARSLTCGNLQSIRVRRTWIDLDPHLQGRHRGPGAIGIRKRTTVEPPASEFDPQAIEKWR